MLVCLRGSAAWHQQFCFCFRNSCPVPLHPILSLTCMVSSGPHYVHSLKRFQVSKEAFGFVLDKSQRASCFLLEMVCILRPHDDSVNTTPAKRVNYYVEYAARSFPVYLARSLSLVSQRGLVHFHFSLFCWAQDVLQHYGSVSFPLFSSLHLLPPSVLSPKSSFHICLFSPPCSSPLWFISLPSFHHLSSLQLFPHLLALAQEPCMSKYEHACAHSDLHNNSQHIHAHSVELPVLMKKNQQRRNLKIRSFKHASVLSFVRVTINFCKTDQT